jgi:predicted phosphodiesterase
MSYVKILDQTKRTGLIYNKVALFGGVYNNYLSLQKASEMAKARGCDPLYQLGDLGGFGPYPDRVFSILKEFNIQCIQGNYEESLIARASDCGCGYTHPKDNYYAALSYDYTDKNLSNENRKLLESFPKQLQFQLGPLTVHLCHGSPRRTNEFLWESTTANAFVQVLARDLKFDILACTHTGIPWKREFEPSKWIVNVGVLGRPANNGTQGVGYTEISWENSKPKIEYVDVHYDWQNLALDMKKENLPQEFIDTITQGFWTTCLEILPGKERSLGRF